MSSYNVSVYFKEDLLSVINVDGESVTFENFSDLIPFLPFGVRDFASYADLVEYYEDRCFPRERANCKQVLKGLGIDYYDPEMICRKTNGVQFDDFVWLQFSDEPQVCWEDVKLRD